MPEEKAGFVVYVPLFSQEQLPKGVVVAGMKAKTLFEDVLGARYLKADFELYDGDKIDASRKLYDSNPLLENIRLRSQETIDVYGRQWTFHLKVVKPLRWVNGIAFAMGRIFLRLFASYYTRPLGKCFTKNTPRRIQYR